MKHCWGMGNGHWVRSIGNRCSSDQSRGSMVGGNGCGSDKGGGSVVGHHGRWCGQKSGVGDGQSGEECESDELYKQRKFNY